MRTSEIAESRPVLFVHGAGGSGEHFAPLRPFLTPDVVSLAPDLPGHGAGREPCLATVGDYARALARWLDEAGLVEPVACVGHSFGGLIALALALDHRRRVASLALLASAARIRLHPEFAVQAAHGRWDAGWLGAAFMPGAAAEHVTLVARDLARLRVGPRGLEGWTSLDLTGRLAELRVPTLVLVPTADPVISPRHGRALARAIAGARQVSIDGAGHYVHLERPARVAAELNAFWREQPARGRRPEPDVVGERA